MAKQYYLSNSEDGKATAFEQFRDNISPYVTIFGLAAADVAQQAADATFFRDTLTFAATMSSAGPVWTAWKGILLTGTIGTEPAIPAKPAGFPPSVPVGILARYLALVNAIKNHKAYTPPIGKILGIEGAELTAPDLTTIRPDIAATLTGNHVLVRWGWGGNSAFLDMMELQVDRGDGKGWVMLAFDTTPNYTDTFPLPAAPTKWKYRGIYRVGDAQVGVWSNTVEITVGA